MSTAAKILGVFILIFLGVPLLIAVIWAAGMAQAATSEEFYSDLSQKVIKRLPELIDKSLEAMNQPGAVESPDSRAWLLAVSKAETSLPHMLERTGIRAWLDQEVVAGLQQVGKAMQGEIPPDSVSIDMRPLKKALGGPLFREYLVQLLGQLPDCDRAGIESWKQRALSPSRGDPLPGCNPGAQSLDKAQLLITARIDEMPDRKLMFSEDRSLPAFEIVGTLSSIMWLLLMVPLLFIGIGAVLAGGAGTGFLRFCGGSVLIAGLISLLLSGLASGLIIPFLQDDPGSWQVSGPDAWIWNTAAGQELATQISGMMGDFFEDLFSPVVMYSWIVTAVGLVLLILSVLFGGRSRESEALA